MYLDQWVWINLARAAAGRGASAEWADALATVRWASEHHLAAFPLSRTHYEETKHMPREDQRQTVGRLMLEISRGHRMIGPSDKLVMAEFTTALSRWAARPLPIQELDVRIFGTGMGFVYDHRPVIGKIVRRDGQPMTHDQLAIAAAIEPVANALAEEVFLCGPPRSVDIPGYDPNADRRLAAEFVLIQEEHARRFSQNRSDRDHQASVLAAAEWIQIAPMAVQTLVNAGIDPDDFFLQGKQFLTDFLETMPVVHAGLTLRTLQHQNPQRPWDPNDFHDIESLSVAIVHCDIVFAERHWGHMLRRARLPEKHQTAMVISPRKLIAQLVGGH